MPAINDLDAASKVGLIVAIVSLSVAGISVAVRFACKALLKDAFHADDWCILLTLATYWAAAGVTIYGVFEGSAGLQLTDLEAQVMSNPTPEVLARSEAYLKALFWGVLLIWLAGYFVKLSICLFYARIFSSPLYRKIATVLIILTTAWIISTEVANIVTCIPVNVRWDLTLPRHCTVNFDTLYVATGIIETILDVAILVVPIRMVFLLQMPMKLKLTVGGIILLGGVVVVTDIIRLAFIYEPGGTDVDFEASAFWLNIHIALSIVCANLPVYKPLRAAWGKMVTTLRTHFSSSLHSLLSLRQSRVPAYETPGTKSEASSDQNRQNRYYLELRESASKIPLRDFHSNDDSYTVREQV
ncbi:hypothetical protein GGR57DRAFT_331982 [Xylariaceae sp. FL1272]|nr:hypothetical protein GGR57DRAFT_331982 [Xylariaceae sp. FL1272]